jgi:predicted TPR repeat methyltransferase
MSDKKGLKDAYSLKTPQDSINLYRDWASTYDIDFAKENGYQSPFLIAKYFEKYSYIEDTPILDVGAGTGLIGECMKLSSEQKIDAIDISPEMLETAKSKQCYSKIIEADLTRKLSIENNYYGAIVSAGTFTYGHIGPNALDELVRITKPNGLFIITIHSKLFKKDKFDKKFLEMENLISTPIYHEEKVYVGNEDITHGQDTVLIAKFRKK